MAEFRSNRGLQWYYDVKGEGEALLFIHGFAGSSRWWENQVKYFVNGYKVITVDLPGHGKSEFLPMMPHEIAVDIKQILASLNLDRVSIISSSMGALIAFELYRLISTTVMRMSFVGGMPKFARSADYPAGLDIENIEKLSGQFDGDYATILDIFYRSLFSEKERLSPQWKALRDFRSSDPLPQRAALKHFLKVLEKVDLRDRFSRVICPLQFIAGGKDYICPPTIMEWMQEHAYNARFDEIPDAGHLPFLSEPQEYNRLLEDFLLS